MDYAEKLTIRLIAMSAMPKKKDKFFNGYKHRDYFKVKENTVIKL